MPDLLRCLLVCISTLVTVEAQVGATCNNADDCASDHACVCASGPQRRSLLGEKAGVKYREWEECRLAGQWSKDFCTYCRKYGHGGWECPVIQKTTMTDDGDEHSDTDDLPDKFETELEQSKITLFQFCFESRRHWATRQMGLEV